MERTVIRYLRDSMQKYAEKTVCAEDAVCLSYQELWDSSHTIAGNLLSRIEPRNPVPVLMKKGCDALAVMWGIIKSGGCYVMLDPMLPAERIATILKTLDAGIAVVADERTAKKLPPHIQAIRQECLKERITDEVGKQVEDRMEAICDIDPLYIMFTSGSTGRPKGVVVNHRSVVDFIDFFVEKFGITSGDVIGNQAPWDFDVSVKDIYSAIKTGAVIQVIARKYFSLPVQLAGLLKEKQVTTLIWAVSALCILSSGNILEKVKPLKIRKVIFSGEVMPVAQYNNWKRQYPDAMFVNVYGPTEITCNCTYCILNREYGEEEVLPIGRAFPNERVFLLDGQDSLVDDTMQNVTGEICVSGTAVSAGYYNAPEETEKHFVQNPLNKKYREVIYRTGDLAYYNAEGELCFLSRKDFQIKHMGHRIELSEIERTLCSVSGISQSCCIYQNKEIVAFAVGTAEPGKVAVELRKKLPQYMIPAEIRMLEELPLNKNGKVDRTALSSYLQAGGYDDK